MSTATLPAAILVLLSMVASAFAADAPNLLRNGDFAAATDGRPESWSAAGDPATVTQQLTVVQEPGAAPYARLACTRCDARTSSSHAMLAQADLSLKRGQMYEFSAQVRATGIRSGVVAIAIRNTVDWSECGLTAEVTPSDRWTTIRKQFKATQDTSKGNRLQIWFSETGTLDLRDVRLVAYKEGQTSFTDLVPAGTSRNLVYNGSFECGSAGWSSLGESTGWGNLAFLHGTIEHGDAADGDAFLRILLGTSNAPELFFDYYQPIARHELSPRAATVGWIPVEPGKPYTLSCQLRASEAGVPAVIQVVNQEPSGASQQPQKQVNLTTTWARYSLTFRAREHFAYIIVGPQMTQERPVNIDVDAVQLEQADQPTAYIAHAPLELALTPSARGGIFYTGDPGDLLIHLASSTDTASDVTVHLEAKDFFGQTLTLPARKVKVAPKTTTTEHVALPTDWRGYYDITASVPDTKAQSNLRLAIVPRREVRDTVCGINHAFADSGLIELADGAGVSWYRDWSLKWQHIEPKPDEWHWEVGDQQIDRVLKENAHVLPLLPPFPSADWNSEAPAGLSSTGYPGVRLRQAWAPRDPTQLTDFISKAVDHYKDRINVWEFLNEPLYTDYALPADPTNKYGGRKYSPADYVKLLALASKAMKSADPKCRVIGGLGGGPLQERTRELMDAGLLQHIDILNLHMYPGLRAPESFAREMDSQLALMDAHGGRKPIWITEFSYYGADRLPRDPFVPMSWSWSEGRLLADERQCADYTVRYFLIMLSHGVERIFIHSGASGQVNQPNFECALFDYGGTPRKLYPALATLTNLMGPAPKSAGFARIGDTGWCAAFETGKRSVVAVWATSEAPTKLPNRNDLAWMNTVGQQLTAAPTQLSTSPVYLIAPSGQAATLLAEIGVR